MNARNIVRPRLLLALGLLLGTWIGQSGCANRGHPAHMSGSAERFHDPSRTSPPQNELARIGMESLPSMDIASVARAAAPDGSLPALDEEVWVIVKPSAGDASAPSAPNDDDIPGCGAIMCRIPDGDATRDVPLPLKHTDVRASISAYIAAVEVQQQFYNPYDGKIEAVYVFPLPDNAAVTGFVMTIGDRKIRGIIRERAEAEQIYAAARSQGHVASLLTQERPNIFTQHVANIEPQKQVDVNITYFHTLAYDDGWYEFVFPMVVGPRFNPPGTSDGVAAVSRGALPTPGRSRQQVEVQYLRPHERSGHDISVALSIAAGVPVEEIVCTSHQVEVTHEASEHLQIALREEDSIPNKDFVVRYRVAGAQVKAALLTHRDERAGADGDGFFSLMLYPPLELDDDGVDRHPMEMIFVMDCSGSMSGAPLDQSKAAVLHALDQLRPGDSFQVVRFSNQASQFGPRPVDATPEHLSQAKRYVNDLEAEGGTMMIEGLRAALDFPHDPERLRIVTFLTDGYIGNERDILGEVHQRLGASRIFSFGVGASPNRYLMARMAKLGRGAVAYLGLRDDGRAVMDSFFARVSRPILTDVSLEFDGATASDVLPATLPDLFVGRPIIITGRFAGDAPRLVRVRGTANGRAVQTEVTSNEGAATDHAALPAVWARMHIADLMDRATYESRNLELPQQVKALALQYGLMSVYTSFVAVDSSARTAGAHGTTVTVAVPVPEGVRYETTVPER